MILTLSKSQAELQMIHLVLGNNYLKSFPKVVRELMSHNSKDFFMSIITSIRNAQLMIRERGGKKACKATTYILYDRLITPHDSIFEREQ